jgi:hypothetical protein
MAKNETASARARPEFDRHLVKPVDPDVLRTIITSVRVQGQGERAPKPSATPLL